MKHKIINLAMDMNRKVFEMAAVDGRRTIIVSNHQELRNQWLSIWTDNFKDNLNTLSTVMSVHQFYNITNDASKKITDSIIVLDMPKGSGTEFHKVLSKALDSGNEVWILDAPPDNWKRPYINDLGALDNCAVVNESTLEKYLDKSKSVTHSFRQGCRPFNLQHAMDGAPIAQRSGLPVRIGFFDVKCRGDFTISGCRTDEDGEEQVFTWATTGQATTRRDTISEKDLVMLPLGHCEGKPVHVGDTIQLPDGDIVTITARHYPYLNWPADCTWPKPEPEMPKCTIESDKLIAINKLLFNNSEWMKEIANAGLTHALKHQLPEIIDYINACGITIRPPDFWVSEQGKAPIISYTQPQESKHQWRAVFYDAKATSNETRNLGHLSNSRLNAALEQMNQYESQDDDLFSFQSFIYTDTTKKQIIDELEERKECPF